MLRTEWDYFRSNLAVWAKERPGAYVLVQNRERVGFFPSFREAVEAGYERLGNSPFLVRMLDPDTLGMPGETEPEEDHGSDHGQG